MSSGRGEAGHRGRAEPALDEEAIRAATARLFYAHEEMAFARLADALVGDLRRATAVVVAGTGRLEDLAPDPLARDEAEEIRSAVKRIDDVARQLSTFGPNRWHKGEPLDVHEVVSGLRAGLRRILGPGVALELFLEASSARVVARRDHLEHALWSVALNARDAMPEGGVLTIRTRNLPDPSRLELTVADTGVGMDESTRARAFEPFYSTKPPRVGAGLGLTVVAGIASALGGRIDLESAPRRGTTLRMILPAFEPAAAPSL
jgi:two-component system cell cycle sensor histidine kinase/response regulator CckA